MEELLEAFRKIPKKNRKKINGWRFTVPSSQVYPFQWLWDSCFHAIIYLKLKEPEMAKDEILSLLSGQWENGMIPHMIYRGTSKEHRLNWHTVKNTSSITQPPMVAYAVERIFLETEYKEFVKETFEKLDRYYAWLREKRGDRYTLYIVHPWESGQDDLPIWDRIYGEEEDISKKKLMAYKLKILNGKAKFKVKSILFNSVYLRNLKSMEFLASVANPLKKSFYREIYERTRDEIRRDLMDRESGLFFAFGGEKQIKIKTANIFLPLFARLLSQKEAHEITSKYLNNEDLFWTRYPVPTVSIDEYSFQPNRYWRGSTWININWFIYKGLKEYNLHDLAEELKKRSFALVQKSGFCEYYNSINGIGHGPSDFTWSGLIFDMT